MKPGTEALDDAILAVLREQWPVPCATPTLIGTLAAGERGRGSDFGLVVYLRLYAMAHRQSPAVRTSRLPNHRVVYWRLAEPPEPLPDVLQQLDSSLRERG